MVYNSEIAAKVAEYLLQIKAIKLSPEKLFTWASGIQSPIYCDNRKSLSHPELRSYIKNSFAELVKNKFPHADAVSGVATAGIAHGALLADTMQLPFSYVRSSPKGHGLQNLIEGEIKPGSKVVVVEDLISTGGSSLKAVNDLRSNGIEVVGLVAIFSYGFEKAVRAFDEAECEYYTLSGFDALLNHAAQNNLFESSQIEFMKEWRDRVGA
jgi:orotate phosphoribosyltransferase